jgi:hypothetical protein
MSIELEYGKRFTYGAFMEFSYLRAMLRQLVAVSQITCEELDNARLHVLKEIQRTKQARVTTNDLIPGTQYYIYNSENMSYEPYFYKEHLATDAHERKRLDKMTIGEQIQLVLFKTLCRTH